MCGTGEWAGVWRVVARNDGHSQQGGCMVASQVCTPLTLCRCSPKSTLIDYDYATSGSASGHLLTEQGQGFQVYGMGGVAVRL